MASLMGVAFMLSSLGTIYAESPGSPNNQDKTCYYKKKCSPCQGGACNGDDPPEGDPIPITVSHDEECPSDPTEVGLDDSYELTSSRARSLRSIPGGMLVNRVAGGFSSDYVNPKNLKVFGSGGEVVRGSDANIKQVKGDSGFLNVDYDEANKKMSMSVYKASDVKPNKVNGSYNLKQGASPQSVISYVQDSPNSYRQEKANYSGSSVSTKGMRVTQTVNQEPNSITHTKTYLKGEGLSAEDYRRATNKITGILNGEPLEEKYLCTVEEIGTDGKWHLVERKAGRRAIYKEEDGPVLLYECDAVNEDGTPMNPIATETTYTYYTDPLIPASFGKVKTLRRNDGYWENKYYDANMNAGVEMIRTESPWLNTVAHEPGEAAQGQIRVKEEVFCNTDTGVESVTETVGGIVISKEWTEKSRVDQQKVKLGKHQPHSGGDKITTTVRYRNAKDIPTHLKGREISVHYADGTMSLYSYTLNGQDVTVTEDVGYGDGSAITRGTRIVSTSDVESGNLKEETRYALEDGQAVWLGNKTGVQFDNAGVCLKWVYDNNPADYTEERKDCCHVTWERSREGIETEYTYDAQGRKISETSGGITKTTEYKGLTTVTWKQSSGNSQRYLVKEEIKDLAGNTVQEKLPVIGGHTLITAYTRDVSRRTMGIITPYGMSGSTSYAADGQSMSVTGKTGIVTHYSYSPTTEYGGGMIASVDDGNQNMVTTRDLQGNIVSLVKNGAMTKQVYDTAGRTVRTVLPDGENVLLSYGADGAVIKGTDMDGDGVLNPAVDRMARTSVVFDSAWPKNKGSWKSVQELAWQGNWIVQSTGWQTEDGTKSRSQMLGVSGYMTTELPSLSQRGQSYQSVTTLPDGQKTIVSYTLEGGRTTAINTVELDAQGQTVSSIASTLNVWGHTLTNTDSRLGTTQYNVDEATGTIISTTTPDSATTSYTYDQYGRMKTTTLPDGSQRQAGYDVYGNVIRQWGSGMYPVSFEYDAQGRKTSMKTYRTPVTETAVWPEGVAEDVTTWEYDVWGNHTSKHYADGTQVNYSYTPGGKIKSITNARGNVSTFNYDGAGQLVSTHHSDEGITPAQQYSYDQWGRKTAAITDGVSSYQYLYDNRGLLTEEDVTISTVNDSLNRKIVRSYDHYGRPTGYQLKNGEAVEQELSYSYNGASLVESVSVDGKQFSYSWVPGSGYLIQQITGPVHTVTNTWEQHRDILLSKTNAWKNRSDHGVISRYSYTSNQLGQRISVQMEGEAFSSSSGNWQWGYDALGQLVSANTDSYSYDQTGNRTAVKKGTEEATAYISNQVNQYTNIGSATKQAAYDADGNMLSGLSATEALPERSGLSFNYNATNRPVLVSRNGNQVEEYAYDQEGRCVRKGDTVIIYNGYNSIAVYDSNSRKLLRTYAWGPDMGGDLQQQEGGVGGLLADVNFGTQIPSVSYPVYDGNGNVTEYVTAENQGSVAAHYEYDSFGTIIRQTGTDAYSYKFSTKEFNQTTGLIHYNYRLYDPVYGRWINRDPIEEKGGINLYGFVGNDGINQWDALGMAPSRPEIERRARELKALLEKVRDCYRKKPSECCKNLYDDYLNQLAQLTRDAGEFYEDQWWLTDADEQAILDVYGLPSIIEEATISQEQVDTQAEVMRELQDNVDNNIFNKYGDEIETAVDFGSGLSDGVTFGAAEHLAEWIHGADAQWGDTDSPWYTAGELTGSVISGTLTGTGTGKLIGKGVSKTVNSPLLGKGSKLFGRGGKFGEKGILNANDKVRVGWSWKGTRQNGKDVFRISWAKRGKGSWWNHFDFN